MVARLTWAAAWVAVDGVEGVQRPYVVMEIAAGRYVLEPLAVRLLLASEGATYYF